MRRRNIMQNGKNNSGDQLQPSRLEKQITPKDKTSKTPGIDHGRRMSDASKHRAEYHKSLKAIQDKTEEFILSTVRGKIMTREEADVAGISLILTAPTAQSYIDTNELEMELRRLLRTTYNSIPDDKRKEYDTAIHYGNEEGFSIINKYHNMGFEEQNKYLDYNGYLKAQINNIIDKYKLEGKNKYKNYIYIDDIKEVMSEITQPVVDEYKRISLTKQIEDKNYFIYTYRVVNDLVGSYNTSLANGEKYENFIHYLEKNTEIIKKSLINTTGTLEISSSLSIATMASDMSTMDNTVERIRRGESLRGESQIQKTEKMIEGLFIGTDVEKISADKLRNLYDNIRGTLGDVIKSNMSDFNFLYDQLNKDSEKNKIIETIRSFEPSSLWNTDQDTILPLLETSKIVGTREKIKKQFRRHTSIEEVYTSIKDINQYPKEIVEKPNILKSKIELSLERRIEKLERLIKATEENNEISASNANIAIVKIDKTTNDISLNQSVNGKISDILNKYKNSIQNAANLLDGSLNIKSDYKGLESLPTETQNIAKLGESAKSLITNISELRENISILRKAKKNVTSKTKYDGLNVMTEIKETIIRSEDTENNIYNSKSKETLKEELNRTKNVLAQERAKSEIINELTSLFVTEMRKKTLTISNDDIPTFWRQIKEMHENFIQYSFFQNGDMRLEAYGKILFNRIWSEIKYNPSDPLNIPDTLLNWKPLFSKERWSAFWAVITKSGEGMVLNAKGVVSIDLGRAEERMKAIEAKYPDPNREEVPPHNRIKFKPVTPEEILGEERMHSETPVTTNQKRMKQWEICRAICRKEEELRIALEKYRTEACISLYASDIVQKHITRIINKYSHNIPKNPKNDLANVIEVLQQEIKANRAYDAFYSFKSTINIENTFNDNTTISSIKDKVSTIQEELNKLIQGYPDDMVLQINDKTYLKEAIEMIYTAVNVALKLAIIAA